MAVQRETHKTLFYPFEDGVLATPGKGMRVLFLGAEPGFRLPDDFAAKLSLGQGFRPHVLDLQSAGYDVAPRVDETDFDLALLLAGRHRGLNELHIAEAIERVAPGGLVIAAGGKEDGVASLRKRLAALLVLDGHVSKHHGVAFWFRRSSEAVTAAAQLRDANPEMLVDDQFRTAPGMFSFDRVDTGSRLLADNLPDDIDGAVADFCAGWGFLSTAIVRKARRLDALDLYEADFASFEAAKRNVACTTAPVRFFWRDLLREPVERRYDVIVMNPPFHHVRAVDPTLGQGMIRAAAAALAPRGRLFMVANRQLPYEGVLGAGFSKVSEIARDSTFKVFAATR